MHADGWDSQDSEAYIPLVKAALQSTATSHGAEPASEVPEGAALEPSSTAGVTAGATAAPYQLGKFKGLPGAEITDSGAAAAHEDASSAGEADKTDKPQLQNTLSSMKAQEDVSSRSQKAHSSQRGDVTGNQATDGRKRKQKSSKKGKGKKRAGDAKHDGQVEACREGSEQQISAGGGPNKIVGNEQRLDALREAALEWANRNSLSSDMKGDR